MSKINRNRLLKVKKEFGVEHIRFYSTFGDFYLAALGPIDEEYANKACLNELSSVSLYHLLNLLSCFNFNHFYDYAEIVLFETGNYFTDLDSLKHEALVVKLSGI